MAELNGAAEPDVTDVGVFDLASLLVDTDNFRLEPTADQPSAIKAMLRKQRGKIVTLAQSIVDNKGLSRGEFIWLAPDDRPEFSGKYVVCEGNRRVTALKLLNEPALAEGTTWSKRFKELGAQFALAPIRKVRAVLYPSVDAARPDVYRRHTNDQEGEGLEAWDTFAQDRANKRAGNRRNLSMVVLEHLSEGSAETLALQLDLVSRTTNADRLLSTFSKQFAGKYGIKIRGVEPYVTLGEQPERADLILLEILRAANVPVDRIKDEGQRETVLAALLSTLGGEAESSDSTSGTDSDTKGSKTPAEGKRDPKTSERRRRSVRDPLDRPTLARTQASHTLRVQGPQRLIGLYQECKTINVDDRPNASAMLLRVFLELSAEAYLTHHSVRAPDGKSSWAARNITMEKKIKRILAREDPKEDRLGFDDVRNGLSGDAGYSHSIEQLHRAMHDVYTLLDPRTIKRSWDLWYPLLECIHDSIADD